MVEKRKIEDELKGAIRSGDTLRRDTLRMVLTSIKLAEIERKGELEEPELLDILEKEVKMRRESIEEARSAARPEMVEKLEEEIAVLEAFLPEPMDQQELHDLAAEIIDELGASSPKEMGPVMKVLMARARGRVEGRKASETVRSLLADR
jgi:uncharacterized protein YqeY